MPTLCLAYVMGRISLLFVYNNNGFVSSRSMVYVAALAPTTTAAYNVIVLILIRIDNDNRNDV